MHIYIWHVYPYYVHLYGWCSRTASEPADSNWLLKGMEEEYLEQLFELLLSCFLALWALTACFMAKADISSNYCWRYFETTCLTLLWNNHLYLNGILMFLRCYVALGSWDCSYFLFFPSLFTSINCPFLISTNMLQRKSNSVSRHVSPGIQQVLGAAAPQRCSAHGALCSLLMSL